MKAENGRGAIEDGKQHKSCYCGARGYKLKLPSKDCISLKEYNYVPSIV